MVINACWSKMPWIETNYLNITTRVTIHPSGYVKIITVVVTYYAVSLPFFKPFAPGMEPFSLLPLLEDSNNISSSLSVSELTKLPPVSSKSDEKHYSLSLDSFTKKHKIYLKSCFILGNFSCE